MQCNQSFCGHGFTNGPLYNYNNNAPFQTSGSMYPEIVGEGEVTSLTLPDGTIQLFFKPTLKWWAPNTYHPNIPNPMQTNIQYNNPFNNNNVGTWFVRSISNPLPPNTFGPPYAYQRFDAPKQYNSDYNIGTNGYQLKFHNDSWTSTTDINFFYPCLCKCDLGFKKTNGTAAVQVETFPAENNTFCHYEVRYSKPCNCNIGHKPMSLESLPEVKTNGKASASGSSSDDRRKRHKRNSKYDACMCESVEKIVTSDKSVTTYSDKSMNCDSLGSNQTDTGKVRCGCGKAKPVYFSDSVTQKCKVKEPESWHPVTPKSERDIRKCSLDKLRDRNDSDDSSSSDCCSRDST